MNYIVGQVANLPNAADWQVAKDAADWQSAPLRVLRRLHRDERGSISIVSVFAVLFLAMLLGMVMNVGRHVDGKIRIRTPPIRRRIPAAWSWPEA